MDELSPSEIILPGKPERALKYEFSCRMGGPPDYRYCNGEWTKHVENVVIDDLPFAEGALRACYRMQLIEKDGTRKNVVAKASKDPNEDRNTYYRDVQAQACAKQWAMEFNDYGIPKTVDFVAAYVFELVDRPGRPLVGAEAFIEGVFQKHNNNVGGVGQGQQEERATPNAFSHFTWEASNRTLLVCDIQGVEDTYTDPQIHTGSGKGFGRGNLGHAGITAFLTRHKCNAICEHLGLPLLGVNRDGSIEDRGGTPCSRTHEKGVRNGVAEWCARTGALPLDLPLAISGASIKIKPFNGGPPRSSAEEEEEVFASDSTEADIPILSAAPSTRLKKEDAFAKPSELVPPKLDKSDEGLMDDILNELEDL